MAENQDGQEKKHAASTKKWDDAAERGQIPKSQDLNALAVIVLSTMALTGGMGMIGAPIGDLTLNLWAFGPRPTMDMPDAIGLSAQTMWATAQALFVPLGAAAIGALFINIAQTRLKFAPKAMEPKLEKLNPITGFKNAYLSWTPLVELGKGLGKLLLLGAVVGWAIWDRVQEIPALATLDVRAFANELQDLTLLVVVFSIPIIMVIAAADYAYSTWKMSEDLKMTDREVKDQQKQQEGDPHWKARMRQRQRQIAMTTMIQALREADVVVTNPTHYAVALRYKRGTDEAPVVVAKGVDHLALHIRAKAKEFGVPRIEDRPLARGLHANVDVGHQIPEEFYGPVAQVLAVIYKRRAKAGVG